MSLTRTADEVVKQALLTLGVIQPGETPDPAMSQQGRLLLGEMVDSWNIQRLTVLVQQRDVYALVANQGGPDNPYTIGPGGDFDTGTAPRPVAIRNASLLLNTTSPYPVEIPLAIITDDMYAAQPIKSILNAQPQSLYYQATVPLGQIQLWNIPNINTNELVLYTDLLTPQFTGASVAYTCPPGYAKAFRLGTAAVLADYYGAPNAQKIILDAQNALTEIKLQNVPMMDLDIDAGFISNGHGTYVIQTDQGA